MRKLCFSFSQSESWLLRVLTLPPSPIHSCSCFLDPFSTSENLISTGLRQSGKVVELGAFLKTLIGGGGGGGGELFFSKQVSSLLKSHSNVWIYNVAQSNVGWGCLAFLASLERRNDNGEKDLTRSWLLLQHSSLARLFGAPLCCPLSRWCP